MAYFIHILRVQVSNENISQVLRIDIQHDFQEECSRTDLHTAQDLLSIHVALLPRSLRQVSASKQNTTSLKCASPASPRPRETPSPSMWSMGCDCTAIPSLVCLTSVTPCWSSNWTPAGRRRSAHALYTTDQRGKHAFQECWLGT